MGIRDWLLELLFPSRCAFCGRLTGPGRCPGSRTVRSCGGRGTTTAPWRFTTTDLSGRASWA